MSDTQVPPQNLDAEESILGAMMMTQKIIGPVAEVIRPEDFYRESHSTIFRAILDLDSQSKPVDAITLSAELERTGKLDAAGGKAKIMELAAIVPASANAPHYARIVREAAQRRELLRATSEIDRLVWEGGDLNEVFAAADTQFRAATARTDQSGFVAIGDAVSEEANEILEAAEARQDRYGLKTGLPTFDKLTTGFHPGDLIVLAARPSVGKSALAQNIAANIAYRGTGVVFDSLEMSGRQLAIRALSRKTDIHANRLRLAGNLTTPEQDSVREAIEWYKKLPLFIEDNASLTLPEIRGRLQRHMNHYPNTGLLVVDYLQLMVGGTNDDNRQAQVAAISRGLKLLAKDLNIPVLALSQLSRKTETRDDKRPMLSDLRDSGAIEQDADLVLFLYRESLYKPVEVEDENDTELIIRKNRMGEPGTVNLTFVKRKELYTEPATHTQEVAA